MADKCNLALVLGGGGARGMAHIGVVKTLTKNNISPDIIFGTSAGAMVGGFYCAGSLNAFEKELVHRNKKQLRKLLRFNILNRKGLINTKGIEKEFRKIICNKKIEELDKKFVAMATDLWTGKRVMISKGDLCDAILASTAIPLIFPPVDKDGMLLVDGGVNDPLPIDEGFDAAKKVIAVNIIRSLEKLPRPPKYTYLDIMERAMEVIQEEITKAALKKYKDNLVVLTVEVNFNTLDFDRAKEAIVAGEE